MIIRNSIKILLYLLALGTALPFLLGFANDLHPLFDSFSHFRVHLLIALLPTLLLLAFFHERRNTFIFLGLVALGSLYLYFVTQPFTAEDLDPNKTQRLKHLQFNLNFRNSKMEKFVAYLKETKPDVVTLQEVTPSHLKILSELQYKPYSLDFNKNYPYVSREKGEYPYQHYCKFQTVGGVAILSRHPINKEKSVCLEGQGLVWSQILVKKQAINIVSIHTYWPYPYHQPQQIDHIKQIFKHITTPTLIAGDFNAASWSHSVKEIERVSHTKAVEGLRWSINLEKQFPIIPNFKLAIDHVLLSKEFQVEKIFVEKDLGSDHFPVVSTIRY
jgi:endonuclease/exonuclease/phosphatase (EEP) superfamily protein YafD